MIGDLVILYLIWFVHAPWWLNIPIIAVIIIKCISIGREIGEDDK